ncbi:MAG TPA: anti-sigma factor [Albitalea sp.]|nr:anti-sigma factor [Albitalea sp.]
MDYSRPALADRLAADYVAGTLRGPARRRFEALLPAHPLLRDAVRDWQARLMPLTAGIEPQAPPAVVWQRIERRLGGPVAGPAPMAWWSRLAVWRGVAGVAAAAAIALSLLLANPGPAQAPIVVVLDATGAGANGAAAAFVASISGDGRAVVTKPLRGVSLQPDRALELWAVPPQGAPRSLGLISAQGTTIVKRGGVLRNTAALAVSLEPPGGSPTGAPTGPVLWAGKLQL